jgi:phosphatidylserine decarboxylase
MRPLESFSRLKAESFRFLPTNQISRLWGKFSRATISRRMIPAFAWIWGIDVTEAELPVSDYPTLNEFFTRRLKAGMRPIDPDPGVVVSPVDGRILSMGVCEKDRIVQIKDIDYSLLDLLGDDRMSRKFENGSYATMYLSPYNYHRIHAPMDMRITGFSYIPGNLLPVNPPSVQWVAGLYTQNERLILYADTPAGAVALVMVGANCVGSIRLIFTDVVTNQAGVGPRCENFPKPFNVSKGSEVAVFEMGSTVVLILEPNRARFDKLQVGMSICMGQGVGTVLGKKVASSKRSKRRKKSNE